MTAAAALFRTNYKVYRPPIHFPFATPHSIYSPLSMATRYNCPRNLPYAPVKIGIISLGGGYHQSDIVAGAQRHGYAMPNVIDVSVGGARNQPGSAADVENLLDIQCVAGAFSAFNGKPADIYMVFAPNTSAGPRQALAKIRDLGCIGASYSWGATERNYPNSEIQADELAIENFTTWLFIADGDDGSSDGSQGNNVDYWASSPQLAAIGVGGTSTTSSGETVWNNGPGMGATGGGLSAIFPRPDYQNGNSAMRRGVPDVAANADPQTGYEIVANGQPQVVGGTSAAAPHWAGGMAAIESALIAQGLPPFGLKLKQTLYENSACFIDITEGDNGSQQAKTGYDTCTGLGRPEWNLLYRKLLQLVSPVVPPPVVTPPPVVVPPPVVTPPPPTTPGHSTWHSPARPTDTFSVGYGP